MLLSDAKDSQWLGKGWHDVRVATYEVKTPSDKSLVEFIVHDRDKQKSKATFWLTDAAAWRLAGFAKACGLSKQQLAKYDTDRPVCHKMLVGKKVSVEVDLQDGSDKYHEVSDWATFGSASTKPARIKHPDTRAAEEKDDPTEPEPEDDTLEDGFEGSPPPDDDDIPF